MGKHYVLADQMYASNVDASSFISHQYIIAGQASSAVNYPSSSWGCEGGYRRLISRRLTRSVSTAATFRCAGTTIRWAPRWISAGLSWAYYASTINGDGGIWSAYQNIAPIYNGPDWKKDVISPQTNFFSDVSNGKLRGLSWITPTCENSDHAGCGSKTGPSWVASLVNAIGESKYWDNTAIFIFWDDYGGWYDPEPPAMLDYDGLGMRIPMLIVSAYAKKGHVSHTHYEHGSILKFVEETFGLAALAASDTRATAPDDAFDFNKPPRKFETVPSESRHQLLHASAARPPSPGQRLRKTTMHSIRTTTALVAGAAVALTFLCLQRRPVSSVPPAVRTLADRRRHGSSSKIQHIVIIVQENRSFNNLFYGFPGAKTVKYGYNTKGDKIALQPVGLETTWDIVHDYYDFLASCNGTGSYPGTDCRMNGFDNEYWGCGHGTASRRAPTPILRTATCRIAETKPYFYLGKHYVLADQMYASNVDASSFISHQYIIAGQASSAVNYPSSWWGCEGGTSDYIATLNSERQYGSDIPMCWNNNTLGAEMDQRGAFVGVLCVDDLRRRRHLERLPEHQPIYNGPDWKNDVISPQTNFFSDVSNGKLAILSWITPTCENSDHAGCGSKTGPSWVASLVNAIGESQYWNNTAIFIFWDDYGGWYDPEPPAMLDYDGLGMRIPMLIVSAYAKKGTSRTPTTSTAAF